MRCELLANGPVGGLGIAAGPDLDQMDEHPAALDMGEELVAEARSRCRSLDQPRDVGEHELAVAVVDRAEDRLERRERVVRHLRRRPRDPPQQRRLAGVRQPHQAGVGEQAELKLDPAGVAAEPALGEPRRLAGRAGEALVAVAAEPAGGHRRPLAGLDEVEGLALEPGDRRPRRHEHDQVVAAGPVLVGPLAVTAALGAMVGGDPHRGQVTAGGVAEQHDVSAVASVAAVGTAARDVRLAPKADDPVAPRDRPRRICGRDRGTSATPARLGETATGRPGRTRSGAVRVHQQTPDPASEESLSTGRTGREAERCGFISKLPILPPKSRFRPAGPDAKRSGAGSSANSRSCLRRVAFDRPDRTRSGGFGRS